MESIKTFTLKNGIKIPAIGYGTYKITNPQECIDSVKSALNLGYRHLDTAFIYGNEEFVGQGFKESGLKREDVFITSKVWNTERGYEKTLKAFSETLKKLDCDYLDLYLIHWPAVSAKYSDYNELNLSSWKALENLYKDGLVKAIGVSNFTVPHLKPLLDCEIKPMVNQIEFHPGYLQEETVKLSLENDVLVEAWSPLGRGRLMENPILQDMAKKYGVSIANICISFCLSHNIIPLVKSAHVERMADNLKGLNLVLKEEDIKKLDAIGGNLGWSGQDPEKIDFA